MPEVLATLGQLSEQGKKVALFADAQPFTLVQVLRGLGSQGTLPPFPNSLLRNASVSPTVKESANHQRPFIRR